MDVDLNIKNYTTTDLINFFQLKNEYTKDDLESKEKEISLSIISSNRKGYTPEYKHNVLEFVKQAKQVLLTPLLGNMIDSTYTMNPLASASTTSLGSSGSLVESFIPNTLNQMSATMIKENKEEYGPDYHINSKGEFILTRTLANNVGKIINPMSPNPVMQTNNILPNGINGYGVTTTVKNYMFNTRYRLDYFTSVSTDCTFILPTKLKNVTSITLSALQYPNVSFAFDEAVGTNMLYIKEDVTEKAGRVTIPNGNYNIETYQRVLEEAINYYILNLGPDLSSNYRFKVTNDPYTHFTTISNTTYTFVMNITNVADSINFGHCDENYHLNPNVSNDTSDLKTPLRPSDVYTSMGYLLGYRKPTYFGLKSYTSESQFSNVLSHYVYFCVDDYNNNNFTTTYGVLPNCMVDENILAVVAITTPQFISTFDSGANFIYKTRHYTAPVDITRIRVKMLNTYGSTVNLYQNDYAFCLEVESLYDNLKPPSQTEIRIMQ